MAVYFIQCQVTGNVKIGWSERPDRRLKALETSCATPIVLVGMLPGGPTLESKLHDRFDACRERGEWFAPSDDLLEYVESLGFAPMRIRPGVEAWKEVETSEDGFAKFRENFLWLRETLGRLTIACRFLVTAAEESRNEYRHPSDFGISGSLREEANSSTNALEAMAEDLETNLVERAMKRIYARFTPAPPREEDRTP